VFVFETLKPLLYSFFTYCSFIPFVKSGFGCREEQRFEHFIISEKEETKMGNN
jgi:hypothetical protein